jgi:hypothetical protein
VTVIEPQAGPRLVGSQTPTIHVVPEHVSTEGREACLLADKAGLVLDPWQRLVLRDGMRTRADGSWSAFEVGLIVARQNGKGGVLEARVLAGLFLLDERLILYSCHEFKTSVEMFRRIEELISGTALMRKRVKRVDRTRGEEGIELLPTDKCPGGQRLRFVARSTGSGRGFSGDLNIWDECQHLPDAAVDALMPTMSARPNPQLWYAGSAPDKDIAPCDQISRVRRRALEGGDKARRLAYFEWSAQLCGDQCGAGCEEHDDPGDPVTWAKTNPGMGIRISEEHVAAEYASMSYRGFTRERLSVGNYPSESGGWDVISEAAWTATADPMSEPLDPVAFAVDVTPDRSTAAIAVAGARADGLLHVEVVEHRPGTDWVAARVTDLVERWRPCAVALDPRGPAGSLVADLEATGVELETTRAADVAAACGAFFDAVVRPPEADEGWASSLRHIPHPALSSALAGAGKRPLSEAWAWDRRAVSVDISPLVAVTLARWARVKFGSQSEYDLLGSVW